jgi:hypothetical protein
MLAAAQLVTATVPHLRIHSTVASAVSTCRLVPARPDITAATSHGSDAVILLVIPRGLTEPNQTGLTRNAAQPELPRPY